METRGYAVLVLTGVMSAAGCTADADARLAAGASGIVLEATTFVGGDGDDMFRDCVVTEEGDVVIVGFSGSRTFPLGADAYQSELRGSSDAVVLEMSGDLRGVVAGTFFGGSDGEKNAYGVDRDAAGNVYLCGESFSRDLPTTANAVQRRFGGGDSDAFAAKLSPGLDELAYATYLGGDRKDACRGGLAVDAAGNAYLAGWSESSDFPTTAGAFQPKFGGGWQDGWVAGLTPDGSALSFSTFLGGSWGSDWRHSEYVVGVALDAGGDLVIAGSTTAADFPVPLGDRGDHHGDGVADAFTAKLSADGSSLTGLTYVAGSGGEWAEHRLAIGPRGHVYLVGSTASPDFPATPGAAQTRYGGGPSDIFVARVDPASGSLDWASYIGGRGQETAFGLVVDDAGNAYLAGTTDSDDFPVTADAAQARKGAGKDAVLVRISADGGTLEYATFLGGDGDETARYVCASPGGDLYAVGHTSSRALPASAGSLQPGYGGGAQDAFVARFRRGGASTIR